MAKKKKKKKKYRVFRAFLKLQIFLILLVLAGLAFYFFGGYAKEIGDLKADAYQKIHAADEETFRASQTSLVYDVNGDLISVLKGEKDVYYLDYQDIPSEVCTIMVTVEDKKFYQHHGVDFKGILRAVKAMIQDGKVTQGGSTITQQLARNVFLTQDRTWERKIEEMFISTEMERIYSKDQILEYYLNNIYFGNGYYGIQAASKGYFNTEIRNLDLSQTAFLCAIPNNPTLYDPVVNMENTLKRRDRILDQMREDGKITETACLEAKVEKITLERPKSIKNDYVETYTYYCATRALMQEEGFKFKTSFKDSIEREAYEEEYDALYEVCNKKLYTAGYRIYTSIDLKMQQELQNMIDTTLKGYTEVNEEGIYTLQSAAVCLDNQTGYVKAIVGGRSQDYYGYTINRAYKSFRQPGSTIKPLVVYTPAFEEGYTPDSIVVDEPIEDGPVNADGSYAGPMTIRRAVELSKNTIAWKLLDEMGPEKGLSYLEKMNFSKLDEEDRRPTIALGGFTKGVSPLEMAAGYATLENDGFYREPSCILKITDASGETVLSTQQEETAVYRENAAHMMTDVLTGVLTNGTGRGLTLPGMPCAGKTGTTNENKDGWFVGYSRYYTTSVWVGYDMPRAMDGLTGSTYPGAIWKGFMEKIHEGLPSQEFVKYSTGNSPGQDQNRHQREDLPERTQDTAAQEEPEQNQPEQNEPEQNQPEQNQPEQTQPEQNQPAQDPFTQPEQTPTENPTQPGTEQPGENILPDSGGGEQTAPEDPGGTDQTGG